MAGPEILVPISGMLMVVSIAVGVPIARAMARRMDREAIRAPFPPEVASRLERMEQAIDSIAVEVERISEAQRFTTKLLSERSKAPGGLPAGDRA